MFKKMHLKVSSAKRRPFCLGLNVLKYQPCLHRKVLSHIGVNLNSNLPHLSVKKLYNRVICISFLKLSKIKHMYNVYNELPQNEICWASILPQPLLDVHTGTDKWYLKCIFVIDIKSICTEIAIRYVYHNTIDGPTVANLSHLALK